MSMVKNCPKKMFTHMPLAPSIERLIEHMCFQHLLFNHRLTCASGCTGFWTLPCFTRTWAISVIVFTAPVFKVTNKGPLTLLQVFSLRQYRWLWDSYIYILGSLHTITTKLLVSLSIRKILRISCVYLNASTTKFLFSCRVRFVINNIFTVQKF